MVERKICIGNWKTMLTVSGGNKKKGVFLCHTHITHHQSIQASYETSYFHDGNNPTNASMCILILEIYMMKHKHTHTHTTNVDIVPCRNYGVVCCQQRIYSPCCLYPKPKKDRFFSWYLLARSTVS